MQSILPTLAKRLGASIALSCLLLNATTAFAGKSNIAGYITWNIAGTGGTVSNQLTFLGLSITRPVIAQGGAESSSSTTLTDLDASWTNDQFNGGNGAHYIEVASGSFAGATFDITDTDAATQTITLSQSLPTELSNANETAPVTFKIRKHWTIASIFGPNNEAGIGGGSSSSADQILIWNRTTHGYNTYYYQTSGIGGVGWRLAGDAISNASGAVIYPDDGLQFKRKQSSSHTVSLDGVVKTGETSFPIFPDINIPANPYPVAMTFATSGLYTGNSSTGFQAGTSSTADLALIYNGISYDTYFYSNSGLPGVGWRKSGAGSTDQSNVQIPGGSSVVIDRQGVTGFDWRIPQHPAALESSALDGTTNLTFTRGTPNHTLSWFGVTGVKYQLEKSTDLLNWSNVGSVQTGANATISPTDAATADPQVFYRLAGVVRGGFELRTEPRSFRTSANPVDGSPGEYSPVSVDLGFSINLFGQSYSQTYVNTDGNLTFDQLMVDIPLDVLQAINQRVIAPFRAFVESHDNPTAAITYGQGMVNGHKAFAANYVNVGRWFQHDSPRNTFQVVLIEREDLTAGDFDIEFNYDQVQWENGDNTHVARAGISNGSNRTVELTGAGVTGAYLDSNATGLITRSRISSKPGRVVFESRNGVINGTLAVDAGSDQLLNTSPYTLTLTGTASNPAGGSVDVTWSVLEAPNGGSVTFGSANSLTTTASFSGGEGPFKIILTAKSTTDSTLSAADTVIVEVH